MALELFKNEKVTVVYDNSECPHKPMFKEEHYELIRKFIIEKNDKEAKCISMMIDYTAKTFDLEWGKRENYNNFVMSDLDFPYDDYKEYSTENSEYFKKFKKQLADLREHNKKNYPYLY